MYVKKFAFIFALVMTGSAWGIDGSVTGKISADTACRGEEEAHIFVSAKRQLIYHNNIPIDGTFRFHLTGGAYEVRAITKSNCHFFQSFELSQSAPNKNIEVNLSNGKRNPAWWNEMIGLSSMFSMPYPFSMPFWGSYGMPMYSNFGYPGPWMNGGLMPGFFPGGGSFAAAKPNLYISSTKKESVDINVDFANKGTRWLASIPAAKDNSWHVELNAKAPLKIEGANYPYIFYDFRGYDEQLQNSEGFCDDREVAITKMIDILNAAKFKTSEVRDFEEYWRLKLPPVEKLCVFPQANLQLDKLAQLNISPPARSTTRRLFVVVPKDKGLYYGKARFTAEPKSDWKNPSPGPIANFNSDVEIREWSVAFLFNQ